MLERLATFSYRRRWAVLGIWVVLLVGFYFLGNAFAGPSTMDFSLPGSDSQAAMDVLRSARSGLDKASGKVVFAADDVRSPEVQRRMEELFAAIEKVPHVASVASPYASDNLQAAMQAAPSGRVAYAEIRFDNQVVRQVTSDAIVELGAQYRGDDLRVEFGGPMFQIRKPPGTTEVIGLTAAVIILLLAFGSVLAMGLPIITALFGIGIALAMVKLLANVVAMPEMTGQLAAMVGIGVGIDYALFIVTRYRQLLHDGRSPEEAVVKSIKTSGKAVMFAGITVVISLMGMFLMRVSFVNGLALGAVAAVVTTMAAAVTLLPAVLGFVGHGVDRLALPWTKRAAATDRNVWYRWSRFIQRRPWVMATVGLVILVGLAWPMFSIRLGTADEGNLPESYTARRAYDLLSDGFGPGFNGQILVTAKVPDVQAKAALPALAERVAATKGVEFASPAVPLSDDVAVIIVVPTGSPQDQATVDLLHRLRDDVLPAATKGTGLVTNVGGLTALFEDLAEMMGSRLFEFIGAVLALSFLLLMTVFRSIFVPLKAVIVNLLSIGAAYGLVVLVFQEGVAGGIVGVGRAGPIESFVPMMLFALLFGLSMDYEVFLLSRIKEEYDITGDNATAVADGLSHTARVITAAAAIMVCVFGSFVFADGRVVKMFGFGMAMAVLIDATVVRMILVPATMELLGDRNWWFPRWLDRILPRIHIEGEADEPLVVEAAAGDAGGTPEDPDEGDPEREPVLAGR